MRKERPQYSTNTDGRKRRFIADEEVHTGQEHPIIGVPMDPPVPKKTKRFSAESWIILAHKEEDTNATHHNAKSLQEAQLPQLP